MITGIVNPTVVRANSAVFLCWQESSAEGPVFPNFISGPERIRGQPCPITFDYKQNLFYPGENLAATKTYLALSLKIKICFSLT